MTKNRLLYLAGLAAALVFHIFYFGWYSWYVLALALCLPWFGLLVSLPAMLRTRLTLDMPHACLMGEEALALLGAPGGSLPLPGCLVRLTVSCGLTGRRRAFRGKLQGTGARQFPLDTAHCGLLCCSTRGSRVCDYLGLFSLPVRGEVRKELLVAPRPLPPERLPDLTRFSAVRRRPKPGGGFSEEHELRDYRPGDNLRDIHWKLSAKTDSLILREAQEPVGQLVLLTFDLRGPRAALDTVLSHLLWLSQWLLEHDTPHEIRWIDPKSRQPASVRIQDPEELEPMLRRVLAGPLEEDLPSMESIRPPNGSWRFHVSPEGEVQP